MTDKNSTLLTPASSFLQLTSENDVSQMSTEEIIEIFDSLKQANCFLQVENSVYENHLKVVRPDLYESIREKLERLQRLVVNTPPPEGEEGGVTGEMGTTTESGRKLSLENKVNLLSKALDDQKEANKQFMEKYDREITFQKCRIEELQIEGEETSRVSHEFENQILKSGLEPMTGRVMAEKYLKFYRDQQRRKGNLVDTLRMRNAVLKQQLAQQKKFARQREEMGDPLKTVDFEKLKVENAQYFDKLQEKNRELLQNKVKAANLAITLGNAKQNLQKSIVERDSILEEISHRRSLMRMTENEQTKVDGEIRQEQRAQSELSELVKKYQVPPVRDYAMRVHHEKMLRLEIQLSERKLQISEMRKKRHREMWRRAKGVYIFDQEAVNTK